MPKRVIHSIKHVFKWGDKSPDGWYRANEEMYCGKIDKLLKSDDEVLSKEDEQRISEEWADVPLCKKCEKEKEQAKKLLGKG